MSFELTEIERLASLMFTADQVCIIAGLDYEQYRHCDAFEQAMLRGRLKQEALLRTSIFDNALAGSSPAQTLAKQLVEEARVASAGV